MIYFISSIFFIWRVLLWLIAWWGEKLIRFEPRFPYSDVYLLTSGLPKWLWSFANFDGVHYLTIEQKGYSAQFTQVFFPLYPYLIATINSLLPYLSPIVTGLFISNILFLFSLVVFYKLLKLDYNKKKISWTIIFLLFFPTSFFFGSYYTESLFIFLVFFSFYAARKKRWWWAGILGGLASATRLVGIFLLPALLWEWRKEKLKAKSSKLKAKVRILRATYYILHSPILYLVPLGLLSYMLYLQFAFGDWLYIWHVQPVFGAQRSGQSIILLPQVIWRYLKIIFTVPVLTESFWISSTELVFSILAICLLIVGHYKRIRISYLIFSWPAVLMPTLTGTFSSMPRYILVAFPIYIVLGMIQHKLLKIFLLFLNIILLIIYTMLFTAGRWVA